MGELVERFFDGATSADEERRLYRFFASGDVPPELERYTELMLGFAAVAPVEGGEATGVADADHVETAHAKTLSMAGERHKGSRILTLWRAAAAVAAVVVVAAGVLIARDARERQELASLYGGSYMIVDGRRVDNLKAIKPQIEAALRMADKAESMADGGDDVVRMAEQSVLDGIGDPEERERVRRIMSD